MISRTLGKSRRRWWCPIHPSLANWLIKEENEELSHLDGRCIPPFSSCHRTSMHSSLVWRCYLSASREQRGLKRRETSVDGGLIWPTKKRIQDKGRDSLVSDRTRRVNWHLVFDPTALIICCLRGEEEATGIRTSIKSFFRFHLTDHKK